jgi:hypothetical protein
MEAAVGVLVPWVEIRLLPIKAARGVLGCPAPLTALQLPELVVAAGAVLITVALLAVLAA